ncbi:hypothetical protein GCM10028803_23460 [Larkinella knui]
MVPDLFKPFIDRPVVGLLLSGRIQFIQFISHNTGEEEKWIVVHGDRMIYGYKVSRRVLKMGVNRIKSALKRG